MSKVTAIYQKELMGFLKNPNFYLVCFLVSVIFSWNFPINLGEFNQALKNSMYQPGMDTNNMNIHYGVFLRHLSLLNFMMVVIVPALTMRLFAEERKMKTIDLLMTSPITSTQIVVGKFLAAFSAVVTIGILATLYPLSTMFFAKINWVPFIVATLGVFSVGAVYVAMNIFCSALTESAIVAFVMAFIFNVGIWFLAIGVEIVDSSMARQIFEHIALNQHLSNLVEGTVRTSSVVFILSLVFLFCFLTERVVEASRWR
jgi:ABC-2 type transport system permease protein